MSRETIIFVPGMAPKQQGDYEKLLATGMRQYAAAHNLLLIPEDGAAGQARTTFSLELDDGSNRAIDLQEIVWGDLLTKLSDTGPFTRFARGLMVLGYWLTPKWSFVRSILAHKWMLITTVVPALVLVAWYYGAVVAAITALGSPEAQSILGIPIPQEVQTVLREIGAHLGKGYVFAVTSLLLAVIPVTSIVDFAHNGKRFLQNEDDLAQLVRDRIATALRDAEQREPPYDRVTVLGYSFGGVAAAYAVAGFRARRELRLITLGAPLGLMVARSYRIADARDKVVANRSIRRWDFVWSQEDLFGSTPPLQADGDRIRETRLRFSTNWSDKLTRKNHVQYFDSDEVFAILLDAQGAEPLLPAAPALPNIQPAPPEMPVRVAD